MQRGVPAFFYSCALWLFFFLSAPPVYSQNFIPEQNGEPFSFVGMKLEEMFSRFGPPHTVYAARGAEHWQDDVVFVYNEGDFYVYRDRVWQVGIKSAYGMRVGDNRAVAFLVLGKDAFDEGDFLLYSFHGGGWPLSLRINFIEDRISAIFIYRPDY